MKKIVFVIAAISILFYFEASAINKNFSPSNFVKIEPLIHSLDLVDSYEYTGTSHEDPEFEITKFAGFEFGSDIYCRKGELGVLRNATPRKSDGLYHPYSVIRSSVIEIEGGFHGFNTVEARYSYLSRKLMSLSFSVRTEGELSRHIFDGFLTVLKEKYGITPSDLSIRFFDGNPLFHSKIGKVSITGGVRKLHRENMEVYFLISNSKYGYVADKESKMVIENPPNEVIRKWVNGFKSKPRYINRNRIQGKICKNGSVRPRFGGLGIGDIVTNAVLISKSMKFEDGRWLQHKRWTVPMTDPTFGFTNAVTVVTENSNTISGIEITDFFSVDPKKDIVIKNKSDSLIECTKDSW